MKINNLLFGLSVSLGLLLQYCTQPAITVSTLGGWEVKDEFEGVARSGAATFTINNIAYVGTGLDNRNQSLQDFWQYNPSTNAWTQKANFPGKTRNGSVAFAIDSKGYLGTGTDAQGNLLRDFYKYDPVTNDWKQIADFGGSARHSAIAFSVGATGFAGTGFDGNEQGDLWAYNPMVDAWTRKADFGGSARVGAVTFVINNLAYIGAGSTNSVNQRDLWAYDPAKDRWIQCQSIPGDMLLRAYPVGFAINNIGYLVMNSVLAYNPASNSWTQKGPFEGAPRIKAAGFAIGSKGYLTAGENGAARYDDLWEFDPTLN